MPIRYFLAALCVFALFESATASAEVRCSCPRISATGVGSTSCSASESDGRCTIDFNVFGERERPAAELLRRFRPGAFYLPDPSADSASALVEASQGPGSRLTDAVLVYMLVALAEGGGQSQEAVAKALLNSETTV